MQRSIIVLALTLLVPVNGFTAKRITRKRTTQKQVKTLKTTKFEWLPNGGRTPSKFMVSHEEVNPSIGDPHTRLVVTSKQFKDTKLEIRKLSKKGEVSWSAQGPDAQAMLEVLTNKRVTPQANGRLSGSMNPAGGFVGDLSTIASTFNGVPPAKQGKRNSGPTWVTPWSEQTKITRANNHFGQPSVLDVTKTSTQKTSKGTKLDIYFDGKPTRVHPDALQALRMLLEPTEKGMKPF